MPFIAPFQIAGQDDFSSCFLRVSLCFVRKNPLPPACARKPEFRLKIRVSVVRFRPWPPLTRLVMSRCVLRRHENTENSRKFRPVKPRAVR
jgi:hypothetical protein